MKTEAEVKIVVDKVKKEKAMRTKRPISISRIFVYVLLILGSIAMLFPLVWLLRSSLMSDAQIFTFPPQWIPKPFTWSNYSEALTIVPFFKYFLNTMTIEVFVITGTILSSSIAAYSFARLKWPGRNIAFGMILSTMMMPYAVTLIPTFIGWKALGAVNTFIPLIVPAWLGGGAFNIFLLRQFFMSLPKELDEAAYLDGATPLTILFKIIIPLSKPALIVVGLFTFIGTWNDFLGPLIYLSDNSKFTLALGLASFKSSFGSQWGYLMAASTVVLIPILVLFFVAQKYFIEGIALTGSKN